jgi:hypothetical protein
MDGIVFDTLSVEVDADRLRWPTSLAADSGNREYVDLSLTGWPQVDETIREEEAILAEATSGAGPGAVMTDLEGHADEADVAAVCGPTDLGTSAATLALNAAGCPTITACSGHQTGYPYIAFWSRREAVPLLLRAASVAGVGLGNAEYGALEVFTNPSDVMGLLRLARELRELSDEFARRVPPSGLIPTNTGLNDDF